VAQVPREAAINQQLRRCPAADIGLRAEHAGGKGCKAGIDRDADAKSEFGRRGACG